MATIDLQRYAQKIEQSALMQLYGKVVTIEGLAVHVEGITASVGELCYILPSKSPLSSFDSGVQGRTVSQLSEHRLSNPEGMYRNQASGAGLDTSSATLWPARPTPLSAPEGTGVGGDFWKRREVGIGAEVVGFDGEKLILMPFGSLRGIRSGDRVKLANSMITVNVGDKLLGRVVDAMGEPIDGNAPLYLTEPYPIHNSPPNPFLRHRINEPLATGVRAIDTLLTIGKGQRIGIFAAAGVGKSTLLGMVARYTEADVNVIALVGERGREVREFIERELGDNISRSVVVVATSDQPALLRVQCAFTATTIAEYFRDRGKHVLLMMDSVTRFAMAQRDIGNSVGEPPTMKGYTPSVFAKLPMLLERAGTTDGKGSITGIYTILVEGDDMNEPIADATRSILDGHIILSRELAAQNHYPAIDISHSLSRLMSEIATPEHKTTAGRFRHVLAIYEEAKDLINIGAYVSGSNPKIDYATECIDDMNEFVRQPVEEHANFQESVDRLNKLLPKES